MLEPLLFGIFDLGYRRTECWNHGLHLLGYFFIQDFFDCLLGHLPPSLFGLQTNRRGFLPSLMDDLGRFLADLGQVVLGLLRHVFQVVGSPAQQVPEG